MVVGLMEKLKALDFEFQNSPVRIIANRNYREIKLVGLTVGPFEQGNIYSVKFWVAKHLVKSGIAIFSKGEMVDFETLQKKHQRMLIVSSEFIRLERFFYHKARELIEQLNEKASREPNKRKKRQIDIRNRKHGKIIFYGKPKNEKALDLYTDILRCRTAKIIYKLRDKTMTDDVLERLTSDERYIFEQLREDMKAYSDYQNFKVSARSTTTYKEYLAKMSSHIEPISEAIFLTEVGEELKNLQRQNIL